jgi:hypothetical protein
VFPSKDRAAAAIKDI